MFDMILASLALSIAEPANPPCQTIAGWEAVAEDAKLRFIVLGEMHGTNEMPQMFLNAVCNTADKRPVVIALELPETSQSTIDSFLASDGGAKAKREFLATEFWTTAFKDGRSSEAMFRLIEDLRRYRQVGKIGAVVAFQPSNYAELGSAEAYEKRMAAIIAEKTPLDSMAMVFVGNVHAMRQQLVRPTFQYLPMAGHLPAEETLSFDIVSDAPSSAWACTGPNICGVTTFGRGSVKFERGLKFTEVEGAPYNGQLFLGAPTTASPPQKQVE